jgi:tol-pal system protein YbgF
MKKRFILFSIIFSLTSWVYAMPDISSLLEQEVQKLTNRVEILEHEIRLLKQALANNQGAQPQLPQQPLVQEPVAVVEPSAKAPESINPTIVDTNLSEKQKYDMALAALKDKKYNSAKEQFADLMVSYPKSTMLDRVMFWYAETFFAQKDFQNSALNYLKCYQKFPKGQKAQDALLKLAMSLSELRKQTEVCKIIKKLEVEFPNRSANAKKVANDLKLKHNCR